MVGGWAPPEAPYPCERLQEPIQLLCLARCQLRRGANKAKKEPITGPSLSTQCAGAQHTPSADPLCTSLLRSQAHLGPLPHCLGSLVDGARPSLQVLAHILQGSTDEIKQFVSKAGLKSMMRLTATVAQICPPSSHVPVLLDVFRIMVSIPSCATLVHKELKESIVAENQKVQANLDAENIASMPQILTGTVLNPRPQS